MLYCKFVQIFVEKISAVWLLYIQSHRGSSFQMALMALEEPTQNFYHHSLVRKFSAKIMHM
jgi:hypothetical protein